MRTHTHSTERCSRGGVDGVGFDGVCELETEDLAHRVVHLPHFLRVEGRKQRPTLLEKICNGTDHCNTRQRIRDCKSPAESVVSPSGGTLNDNTVSALIVVVSSWSAIVHAVSFPTAAEKRPACHRPLDSCSQRFLQNDLIAF